MWTRHIGVGLGKRRTHDDDEEARAGLPRLHVDRAEALHERRAASQSGAEIALAHEHRGTLGRAIVLAAERALPRRSRRGSIGGGGGLVAKPHSQRLQVGTCVCQAYLHTKLSAASVAAGDERGLRSHMLRRLRPLTAGASRHSWAGHLTMLERFGLRTEYTVAHSRSAMNPSTRLASSSSRACSQYAW